MRKLHAVIVAVSVLLAVAAKATEYQYQFTGTPGTDVGGVWNAYSGGTFYDIGTFKYSAGGTSATIIGTIDGGDHFYYSTDVGEFNATTSVEILAKFKFTSISVNGGHLTINGGVLLAGSVDALCTHGILTSFGLGAADHIGLGYFSGYNTGEETCYPNGSSATPADKGSGFIAANVWYYERLRFSYSAPNYMIKLKVWKEGQSEPGSWDVEDTQPLPIAPASTNNGVYIDPSGSLSNTMVVDWVVATNDGATATNLDAVSRRRIMVTN